MSKLKRNAIIGLVLGVFFLAWGVAQVASSGTYFGWLFVALGILNVVGGTTRLRKIIAAENGG